MTAYRPPYWAAAAATLLVLLGYVITLAPTVTFWDAGEFIAAAKTLGIPHPPGTPLFVMLGHVWGSLIPVGTYAERLNFLSACMSALAAGGLFLVAHESLTRASSTLEGSTAQVVRVGGGLAAALISGFTFTNWQNSNETEVYSVAMFTIAAISWLALRWRAARGTPRAAHLLLLILYLAGMAIGNHLLALLAGPAVVGFLAATLHHDPAADPSERRMEWAQVAVVGGTWALLIGSGLGSTLLTAFGGICYLAALTLAASARSLRFGIAALVVAAIGITTYLFLYIRASHGPAINEAQPDNWNSLLAVIRREQYPIRTPLDDPTQMHGPDNPGRSLLIVGLQLLNYLQYYDWQWLNGIRREIAGFPLRTVGTLLFFSLGLRGMILQRRNDRSGWWLLFLLWLVTGLGLVAYMNFKPGFSLAAGYKYFPDAGNHEVRDRDYFFVVSFVVWAVWAGMGLAAAAGDAIIRWRWKPVLAAVPLGVIALLPFAGNFEVASRRHGRDATLAADFAYDLLNSVPPYGILFTYGDNDTFPLWWAQEVAGIRQDVLVVCLALAETDWYKRQLRDNPIRPFDEASAPPIWRGLPATMPDWPPHSMSDGQIGQAVPVLLPQDVPLQIGPIRHVLAKGTPVYSRDFVVLRLLQDNAGKRPIAWSLTTGGEFYGLDRYLLQQGLVMRLEMTPVDTTRKDLDYHGILGLPMDPATTERLVWDTYRYAGFGKGPAGPLEPTAAGVANNLSLPFAQLAYWYQSIDSLEAALRNLTRASDLSTNPAMRQALMGLLAAQAEGRPPPR